MVLAASLPDRHQSDLMRDVATVERSQERSDGRLRAWRELRILGAEQIAAAQLLLI